MTKTNKQNNLAKTAQPWSDDLIRTTERIIDQVEISSFFPGYCIMKSRTGYGKISMIDAINYKYIIRDIDSDEILIEFESLNDLIVAGWVVD